jgi:16S rRNA (cytidine1402-2'-O)-methyltransferase
MKGKLYLIPSFIGNENCDEVFPRYNIQVISSLRYFVVEEIRTARRFLKKVSNKGCFNEVNQDSENNDFHNQSAKPSHTLFFDGITFFELNEHTHDDISSYLQPCEEGYSVGLISEAGVPCIADPGSELVRIAHRKQIEVIPLIGPSSILLALMASGLNGQNFAFTGYLPVQKVERQKSIRQLEQRSFIEHQTQCFIEAPYRNQQLLSDILEIAHPDTLLCIGYDITLPSQLIFTQPIREWKKKIPDIQKHPAIFLIMRE